MACVQNFNILFLEKQLVDKSLNPLILILILLLQPKTAPKENRYPIFVTLSLRVECSLNGSHSILALRPQIGLSYLLGFVSWGASILPAATQIILP